MTATRRLAAILAADVVGYSRLMGEDEAGTALRVREHRQSCSRAWRRPGASRGAPRLAMANLAVDLERRTMISVEGEM